MKSPDYRGRFTRRKEVAWGNEIVKVSRERERRGRGEDGAEGWKTGMEGGKGNGLEY